MLLRVLRAVAGSCCLLATVWPAIAEPCAAADVVACYRKEAGWPAAMAATRRAVADAFGKSSPEASGKDWDRLARRFWHDYSEFDWFLQDTLAMRQADAPAAPSGAVFDATVDLAWYFAPARDSQPERRLIERAIKELDPPAAAAFSARLAELVRRGAAAGDAAWLELYVDACRARRAKRLAPFIARAPQFVFTKHYTLGGSHYAYTEGQSDAQNERHFIPGAALCLATLDPAATGQPGGGVRVETLLEDPTGVIRDPDVSFDARRVVFAWKKSADEDDYHLYEMDLDTRRLRPLTSGLGVADYEPAYLSDGDIVFNSTRCVQTVDCWWTEVSNLYRCNAEGRMIRRLAFDQVHDNYPTVTGDGRVLYTRWEYNDRGQIYPQPLFQMNPDGTNQGEFYGVNSWFPTTILHARNIPGTQKVVAIATGHHSRQTGKLIVIDPARGRQENEGVRLIAPPRETPAEKIDAYGQHGDLFQYPYPLSENEFLLTYHPVGWRWEEGPLGPLFGVYAMTADGRRELLVRDARLPCGQAVPRIKRPTQPTRPTLVDYRRNDATCYVQDVYQGPGLAGVPRGTIQRIRVVAIEFRPAGIGANYSNGPGGGALSSTPVSIGNGAWDPKIILGDAKVYADGSAFFRVPARTSIYFQMLDAKGRMVQSMRSWSTLQPGENASCVGCHEAKHSTPLAVRPATEALRAGVEPLAPFYGPPRGFSFARDIQPMLDRKCVSCHDGTPGKPLDLTGRAVEDLTAKRRWSQAYLSLTHATTGDGENGVAWQGDPDHPRLNWISAQSTPPIQPPYSAGSNRSAWVELLEKGHEKTTLTREELDKFAAWIDLGVPFCADYTEAAAWSDEEKAKYAHFLAKRKRLEAEERAAVQAWLRRQ